VIGFPTIGAVGHCRCDIFDTQPRKSTYRPHSLRLFLFAPDHRAWGLPAQSAQKKRRAMKDLLAWNSLDLDSPRFQSGPVLFA
jgi:hypothetical protein